MLQSCQNLVHFPTTRFLDADYGTILANHEQFKLDDLLNSKFKDEECIAAPHLPITRTINSDLTRSQRESVLKNELSRQISSLHHQVSSQQQRIQVCQPLVKTLLEATRSDPASAAQMLWAESEGKRRTRKMIQGRKRRGRLLCASGQDCGKVTLPFSKFCLEHQSCDPSQLLYPTCSCLDPKSLVKCNRTVLDIFSDNSLCPKHLSDAVPTAPAKRKALSQASLPPAQKKVKVTVAKVAREKKSTPTHNKAEHQKVADSKSLTGWSAGDSDDGTTASVVEGSKPVASSKSLDDLLTLDSSLTAHLPKLDLLPLKADIGEIMMAGEDSSGDD